MKTRKLFAVFLLMMLGLACQAQQQVTEREAINAAVNTMRYDGRNISALMVDTVFTMTKNNRVLLYEVHFSTGESVLMSGSKACEPVLGMITNEYGNSTIGLLNQNHELPEALQLFIDSYAEQIEYCFENNLQAYYSNSWDALQMYDVHKEYTEEVEVSPLLTTKWGQTSTIDGAKHAYNYYVTQTSAECGLGDESYCPAGCVAVAIGQVMKYWNYPNKIPNKCWEFDFSSMPNELDSTSSNNYINERNSVARLLKDIGTSVNMEYCVLDQNGDTSCLSGISVYNADDVETTFRRFGYLDAELKNRNDYSETEWRNILVENLVQGYPVYYSGAGYGGHAFVVHGYKKNWLGNHQFYINWGWLGEGDGWFTLNNLHPYYQFHQSYNVAVVNVYPSYCWEDIRLECAKEYDYLDSDTYRASNIITNDNNRFEINWGAHVEMYAKEIVLSDGFCAHAGSFFCAIVDPCQPIQMGSFEENYQEFINYGNDVEMQRVSVTNKGLTLFPNPVIDKFNVYLNPDEGEIAEMSIMDLLGNTILRIQNNPEGCFDVSILRSGLYLICVVTNNENKYILKLVKK